MAEDRLSTDQATAPIGQDRARGGTGRARAAIVIVCRDANGRETLNRELSRRYGADYQIVVCDGPAELEPRVRNLLDTGTPVALVIGGVGALDPDGTEVLAATRAIDPTAPRVAAVRWGDFEAARPTFDAVTLGKIDHWGDASCAGSGRGVPSLDHRLPGRVEQPARRWLRGGASDRPAMVRPVSGAG
jgi:hypothetical protein